MSNVDRILTALLVLGVWILVAAFCLTPSTTQAAVTIEASEIEGLEDFVEEVIEDCRVSGEVYIYDSESGYGELASVSIDC